MKGTEEMKTVKIDTYNGYRHNRYDGYNCSWGVLIGMGASTTAECFSDNDDYPDEEFHKMWNGDIPLPEDFKEKVLSNLDWTENEIEDIKQLEPGETIVLKEHCGNYTYDITFENVAGKIICNFDGDDKFICEF